MVVEFVRDFLRALLEGDEVEDVVVLLEHALDFDGGAVVVAVEPLALVAAVADEVPAAEHQVVFGDADFEALGRHVYSQSLTCQRNGAEGVTLFSRSATNRQAVMRSAVVPGFSLFPSLLRC